MRSNISFRFGHQLVDVKLVADQSAQRTRPTAVIGGHSFTSISAGWEDTCGITTEGVAYCWGADSYGSPRRHEGPRSFNARAPFQEVVMKRFNTRLAMLACLTPLLAGCWTTEQIPLSQYPPLSHATSVTTSSGSNIRLHPRGAYVVHDTLRATSSEGQVIIPADSIALVSVRKFSWGRAIALYFGAGTVVAIILSQTVCNQPAYTC